MIRKFLIVLMLFFASTVLYVLVSCNSTPTVPVPPPEMTMVTVSSPDLDGFVTVTGEPDAAGPGDVVIVFNDNDGSGVLEEAMEDGSFNVVILAQTGDVLVVQVKRDNKLSSEEELVVP